MNYLTLVNDAITESGLDLSQLTSTSFTTTTESMHLKMKRWVNQAWEDIQLETNSWQFNQKRGTFIIRPRIYVEQVSTSTDTIRVGHILYGNDSGASLKVLSVELISGAWGSGTAIATLDYEELEGTFKFNERLYIGPTGGISSIRITNAGTGYTANFAITIDPPDAGSDTATATAVVDTDLESPTYGTVIDVIIDYPGSGYTSVPDFSAGGTGTGFAGTAVISSKFVCRFTGWGRYNMQSIFSDLLEYDDFSFIIQSTGGSTTQTNTTDFDPEKVYIIPWEQFNLYYETGRGNFGRPRYLTVCPDGKLDFYPRPDKEYVLHFNYRTTATTMTAYNDSPTTLPADYHNAIMWRAVWYYGQYEENASVERRGYKRWMHWKRLMERNLGPKISFAPSRYRFTGVY